MTLQPITPITRLRATLVSDGYGNSEPDWTSPASQAFGVHWSPQSVSEVVGDEPQTVTRIKVFGWPPFDLEPTDRIVGPDGNTYEVDGDVMRSYHPRSGALHHVRAFLRRAAITGN
jgi:hypothetical protein